MGNLRKQKPSLLTLASAAALLGSVSIIQPANAATFLFTYKGTVSSGSDDANVFGLGPGANIIGHAFTSVYTVTYPSPGGLFYSSASLHVLYGGDYFAVPNPVSGRITINGVTREMSGGVYSDHSLALLTPGSRSYIGDQVCGSTCSTALTNYLFSDARSVIGSLDFTAPVNVEKQTGDDAYGGFLVLSHQAYGGTIYDTRIQFVIQSVTGALAGAVPEPSTWAMMLLGVGGIGGAMRRRRQLNGARPLSVHC